MEYDLEYLLASGQLRAIPPSKNKSDDSLRAAREWLEESRKNLKAGAFKGCLLLSYLAMFEAARAVAFRDGFREKTHYAVARYLEGQYAKKGKLEKSWIELLDHFRDERNQDQYHPGFCVCEEDADRALDSATRFIGRIEKLLGSPRNNHPFSTT